MNFDELVEERRSVRSYREGEATKEQIDSLIYCVQQAPSWRNSQTGRYYIARSKEAKERVLSCLPEFNRNNSANASFFVVATFEKGKAGVGKDGNFANEAGEMWGAYDLGLQNELLVLKARDLGLDTLIMGIRDGEALKEAFAIPDEEMIMAVIAVGYRAVDPPKPKRKEAEEIVKIF